MSCDNKITVKYENVIETIIIQKDGWLQYFELIPHENGFVIQLKDYFGGEGEKPTEFIGWYMGTDGWVKDIADAYVIGEKGSTPEIGLNGNWFIDGEDTGLPSRGNSGDNKIPNWIPEPVLQGEQRLHNDIWWEAVVDTTALQEPGVVAETIWKKTIKQLDLSSILSASETTKAVSGKAVADYAPKIRTYNLLDVRQVQLGKYVAANGVIANSASFNITGYIPIQPNKEYRNNLKPAGNTTVSFFDENKVWISNISQPVNVFTFTSPANAYFVIYNLNLSGVFDGAMLVEGKYIKQYLPYELFFDYRSFSTLDYAKSKKQFRANENIGFRLAKSSEDFGFIPPVASGNYTIVKETNETAKRYGSQNALRFHGPTTTIIVGGTINFGSYDKIPNYLYASAILKTNNPIVNPPNVQGIKFGATGTINSYITREVIELEPGVYLANIVCAKPVSTGNSVQVWMWFGTQDANTYNYELSGLAYHFSNELLPDLNILYPLYEEDRWNQRINSEVYFSGYNYIEDKIRRKKVCLYGTSIEIRPYFNRVAAKYDLTYLNFAFGGGGVLYSEDDAKLIQMYGSVSGAEFSLAASWSATVAEKEAFFATKGWVLSEAGRRVSYDISMLTELDTDVFLIGTYGINDRGVADALVIDKVNRKYDRTTIYGAYNYVLRKLFEAKPTARVIIFGQFNNNNTDEVNEIQREVCKDWCIPFLDWGSKMGMTKEKITVDGVEKTVLNTAYATDGLHPDAYAQEIMGEYLIRALRDYL